MEKLLLNVRLMEVMRMIARRLNHGPDFNLTYGNTQ